LLKLEGINKTRQWEDFIVLLITILCDYSLLFVNITNLSIDQHASIDALATGIANAGTGGLNSIPPSAAITDTDIFEFSPSVNRKLYSILLICTSGHAHEIMLRIQNQDGRQALFMLRADALKQTNGQIISLTKDINDWKIPNRKYPAASIDTLSRMTKELDCLLKSQDQSSQYGVAQQCSAIINALPDNYENFKIARDGNESSSKQTVDELTVAICNHYSSYIQGKHKAENAGAVKDGKNGGDKPVSNKKGKEQQQAAKVNQPPKKTNKERGKKGDQQAAAETGEKEARDCIICKQLDPVPKDIKHYFKDCPSMRKLKGMEVPVNGVRNNAKGKTKYGRHTPDLDDDDA
jgi:hypothetical protein